MQVALAWLHRTPNIFLIPGTSSPNHLRENLAAAQLVLPDETLGELKGIGQRFHIRTDLVIWLCQLRARVMRSDTISVQPKWPLCAQPGHTAA
jgi:hypothetical protein